MQYLVPVFVVKTSNITNFLMQPLINHTKLEKDLGLERLD